MKIKEKVLNFLKIAKEYHSVSCDEYECEEFEQKRILQFSLGVPVEYYISELNFNKNVHHLP